MTEYFPRDLHEQEKLNNNLDIDKPKPRHIT